MHSASETNLPILGAALLRIRVQLTGIETRQMDFSSMATKLYLSLATCADLGLILKEFPFSTLMPPEGDSQASGATPGSHPTYHGRADHADPLPPPLLGPPSCPPTPPTGNGQARARGPTRMLTPLQELQGGGRCQVYQATHSGQHWTRRSPKRPVPSGPPAQPGHWYVPRQLPLRQINTRPAPGNPCQIQTASGLDGQTRPT